MKHDSRKISSETYKKKKKCTRKIIKPYACNFFPKDASLLTHYIIEQRYIKKCIFVAQINYIFIITYYHGEINKHRNIINKRTQCWKINAPCVCNFSQNDASFFSHIVIELWEPEKDNNDNSSMKPFANSLIIWWENSRSFTCVLFQQITSYSLLFRLRKLMACEKKKKKFKVWTRAIRLLD